MACTEVLEQSAPQQSQVTSTEASISIAKNSARCHRGSAGVDLECLVCREPYSSTRLPKVLGCQHAFCAICLKLLLCVQNNAWSITCPLCREVTAIPGGLICSLQDQKAMRGQLTCPVPEVRLCPQELEDPNTSAAELPNLIGENEQNAMSANRIAARRLAAQLFLLILLIIFILPFVYPGVLRWVLTFIIGLALLMFTLFCLCSSSQGSCWPLSRTLFCIEKKHSQIASVA